MKQITASDINPHFLFILDMYGATERFVSIFNKERCNPIEAMKTLNDREPFIYFMSRSFVWNDYWQAIANQNEPEIERLTKLINK